MKISNKTVYGLRAMVELGLHHGGNPIGVRVIAKRQGIPVKVLEQIVQLLKQASLIRSVRGAKGGYVLDREPEQISIGVIFKALEGGFSLQEELASGHMTSAAPAVEQFFAQLGERIQGELNSSSLADLVRNHRDLLAEQALDFSI